MKCAHHYTLRFFVMCMMSLIPEHTVDTCGSMAESTGGKPYQFEPASYISVAIAIS